MAEIAEAEQTRKIDTQNALRLTDGALAWMGSPYLLDPALTPTSIIIVLPNEILTLLF